jgi:hypothetical protein
MSSGNLQDDNIPIARINQPQRIGRIEVSLLAATSP